MISMEETNVMIMEAIARQRERKIQDILSVLEATIPKLKTRTFDNFSTSKGKNGIK